MVNLVAKHQTQLMLTGELRNQVDNIWNTFWNNGISNPLTVIEQFTYLIYLKRLDDQQLQKEKETNLLGIPMDDPLYPTQYQALRWSRFKDLDPEKLFDIVSKPQADLDNLSAFEYMKNIGDKGGVYAQYMKDVNFIIPTPRTLSKLVDQIDKLPLDKRDTMGDLYEYMLSKIADAGQNGQFRTPRHIIRMMVHLTDVHQDDVICDPACGTSGFLVAANEYINENHSSWFEEKDFREHHRDHMFYGTEVDSTMLRIGAMNLQLHGISPQLSSKDSLSNSNGDVKDEFSLVLANPPFTGSLDYEDVESSLLQTTKTKKTELLFMSLILRILKKGGRGAVIVPDGVVFGSSRAHKSLRKTLVEDHQLQGVISMPSGVFKPYAGVSTAILLFTKTGKGGTGNVWFYDMKADGYSLDDKRNPLIEHDELEQCFSAPEEAAKTVEDKCDIPLIIRDWQAIRHDLQSELSDGDALTDRTAKSFLVPKSEIVENDYDLSINRYKEIVYEEIEYDPPAVLIDKIKQLDEERNAALRELEGMLG